MKGDTFTLGELAQRVALGNLIYTAKLLNDAGMTPRLDERNPDPSAEVPRVTVIDLVAMRAGTREGRICAALLGETIGGEVPE